MAERIVLKTFRNEVDREYVGFSPNGSAIKPVHVAGGVLRCIDGSVTTSMGIKKMALVSDAKGVVPAGNELDSVYQYLLEREAIDEGVPMSALESLRNVMQRLLSADKGVFVVKGLKDSMLSYTAGSKHFITRKAMYEDTGEFIGSLIREYCPTLANYIKSLLDKAQDPITLLFEPVLESDETAEVEGKPVDDIPAFKHQNDAVKWFVNGIRDGGNCLYENFVHHPNPLTQLRLFDFFCIFHILRYLTLLEAFYCGEVCRPILLDFSGITPSQSSVARASEMSYTLMHKSINRFYAWAFSKKLSVYSKQELLALETPTYEENKVPNAASQQELNALWNMAKENAEACENEDEIRILFGETMYDMLALEASSHPVNFLRALGTSSGVLYPPDKLHPSKRFVPSQDVLEMLLRSCVKPNEVLSSTEIRERLWNHFGVIVGGSDFEFDKLRASNAFLQVDEDALEDNFRSFASTLESMDFAEMMADGILQIRLGGATE